MKRFIPVRLTIVEPKAYKTDFRCKETQLCLKLDKSVLNEVRT